MNMKNLTVLAECADSRSGRRFVPGEQFDPAPTRSQAKRLIAAGCLPDAALDAAVDDPAPGAAALTTLEPAPIAQANDDGLFDLGNEELSDIILSERVPIDEDAMKAVIVASIRRHRENVANGAAIGPAALAAPSADEASTAPAAVAPQPLPENLEMRTEDGERAAREVDAAARDEHAEKASVETDPLDHDGDGRSGGSVVRGKRGAK